MHICTKRIKQGKKTIRMSNDEGRVGGKDDKFGTNRGKEWVCTRNKLL